MLKLHIGSGGLWMPGWVHIDKAWALAPEPIEFIHHDLLQGIPFGDGTVDLIYGSHMLDHFSVETGVIPLLKECHRVMKPGAVARFAVMNVEKIVKAYQRHDMERFDYCQPAFYRQSKSQGLRLGLFLAGSLSGRREYTGHWWATDFAGFGELAKAAGFETIVEVQSGESSSMTMQMDVEDTYEDHSLYVEVTR